MSGNEDPVLEQERAASRPHTAVLAIEEARNVTSSLIEPWKQDWIQSQTTRRPWPLFDPTLRRGALSAPSPPPPPPTNNSNIAGAPKKKRKREEIASQPPPHQQQSISDSEICNTDGSLPLPHIPGVPAEKIQEIIDSRTKKRCGVCSECLARTSHRRPCASILAARTWGEKLGGVTYAALQEVVDKLAARLRDQKTSKKDKLTGIKIGRSGYGFRCGLCTTCRHISAGKASCLTINALTNGTLPQRLKIAADEMQKSAAAAASGSGSSGGGGGNIAGEAAQQQNQQLIMSLEEYLKWIEENRKTSSSAIDEEGEREDDDDEVDDDDEDDDVLRWAPWSTFLRNPPQLDSTGGGGGDESGSRGRLPQQQQRQKRKRSPLRQEATVVVEVEPLTDWVCHARIEQQQQQQQKQQKKKQKLSSDDEEENSDDDDVPRKKCYEECGHSNLGNLPCCAACGTARWDGPLGQLRARIAAALQTGLLTSTGPFHSAAVGTTVNDGGGDVDDVLVSTLAARIAAETGNFSVYPLPGLSPQEDGEEDTAAAAADATAAENFYQAIAVELAAVRKGMAAAQAAAAFNNNEKKKKNVLVGGDDDVVDEGRLRGGAVKRTKFAQSVAALERSVYRLVEEEAVLMKMAEKKKKKKTTMMGAGGGVGNEMNDERRGGRNDDVGNDPRLETTTASTIKQQQHDDWSGGEDGQLESLLQLRTLIQEWGGGGGSNSNTLLHDHQLQLRGGLLSTHTTTLPSFSMVAGVDPGEGTTFKVSYSAFKQRIMSILSSALFPIPSTTTTTESTTTTTVTLLSMCDLLFFNAPLPLGWTETSVSQLESILEQQQQRSNTSSNSAAHQLKIAAQIGGSTLFRQTLDAVLHKEAARRRDAAENEATEDDGVNITQQQRQLMGLDSPQFLLPTQLSQQEPPAAAASALRSSQRHSQRHSQSQSQSQFFSQSQADGGGGGGGERRVGIQTVAQLSSSISMLDEMISSCRATEKQKQLDMSNSASIHIKNDDDDDDHRMKVFAHVSASTMHFLYTLTHSVLNSLAVEEAVKRIPDYLLPSSRVILEHERFPNFPPLPQPPPTTTTTTTPPPSLLDNHEIRRATPDFSRLAQNFVPKVLPEKKKPGPKAAKEQQRHFFQPPHARPGGAFDAVVASETETAAEEHLPEQGTAVFVDEWMKKRDVADAAAGAAVASLIEQCPKEVKLVFSQALSIGVRPEVVTSAVMEYFWVVEGEGN